GGDEDGGIPGRRIDRPTLPHDGPALAGPDDAAPDTSEIRRLLQAALTRNAGVLRGGEALVTAAAAVARLAGALARSEDGSVARLEVRKLVEVGAALVVAAAERTESRGCHTRSDAAGPSDDLLVRCVVGGPASEVA